MNPRSAGWTSPRAPASCVDSIRNNTCLTLQGRISPPGAANETARAGEARGADEPRSVEQRWLPTVRRAILERRTVRFQYHARDSADAVNGDQPRSEPAPAGRPRQADPYGLAHVSGAW